MGFPFGIPVGACFALGVIADATTIVRATNHRQCCTYDYQIVFHSISLFRFRFEPTNRPTATSIPIQSERNRFMKRCVLSARHGIHMNRARLGWMQTAFRAWNYVAVRISRP
jgi:hypothetical protein